MKAECWKQNKKYHWTKGRLVYWPSSKTPNIVNTPAFCINLAVNNNDDIKVKKTQFFDGIWFQAIHTYQKGT